MCNRNDPCRKQTNEQLAAERCNAARQFISRFKTLALQHLQRKDLPLIVGKNAHLAVSSSSQGVCHKLDLGQHQEHDASHGGVIVT
jgi:hypothetical protein